MIRKDGTYTIYRIQHSRGYGGGWGFSSFDHFGTPPGFSASDACWQETGVMGTYDHKVAVAALTWMQKNAVENAARSAGRYHGVDAAERYRRENRTLKFRLVKVEISQKTIPIEDMSPTRAKRIIRLASRGNPSLQKALAVLCDGSRA